MSKSKKAPEGAVWYAYNCKTCGVQTHRWYMPAAKKIGNDKPCLLCGNRAYYAGESASLVMTSVPFDCLDCGAEFEKILPDAAVESGDVHCPECGSAHVRCSG